MRKLTCLACRQTTHKEGGPTCKEMHRKTVASTKSSQSKHPPLLLCLLFGFLPPGSDRLLPAQDSTEESDKLLKQGCHLVVVDRLMLRTHSPCNDHETHGNQTSCTTHYLTESSQRSLQPQAHNSISPPSFCEKAPLETRHNSQASDRE